MAPARTDLFSPDQPIRDEQGFPAAEVGRGAVHVAMDADVHQQTLGRQHSGGGGEGGSGIDPSKHSSTGRISARKAELKDVR